VTGVGVRRDASPAIDTVVFDLGGVLIDWDPRHLYRSRFASDEEMETFLADVCSPAWHRQHDEGRPMRDTIPELAAEHPDLADQIGVWSDQERMIAGPLPETVELLGELRGQRVRLLALTNWCRESFATLPERFPFVTWFEGIVVSSIEGVAKPDVGIFDVLIRRYGVTPTRALYIDDSLEHVATARTLGFATHRFQTPAALRTRLVALGLLPDPAPGAPRQPDG
jgi:2-haloacid dehalogenase